MDLPIEFLREMQSILPDYDEFLCSYEQSPTKAFRINELKVDDNKLLAAMGTYMPVPFAEHCYYIDAGEKWGNHPFHHAGLMYFQEPSAMLPVSAYDVSPTLALDMCAAPGGKSLQLAQKAKYLVSNEINPSRAAVLKSNVERMGAKNIVVTNHSPQELEKLGAIFDLVLVDAPCSGEGMFRKDEVAIEEWSEEHSKSCAVRQNAILESADKLLKKGGTLIYSTCTFSRRENEDVINVFLQNHDYSLKKPLLSVIERTTYLSDERMRRFYPHKGVGEGQFFVALTKNSGESQKLPKSTKYAKNKTVDEFLLSSIGKTTEYCCVNDMYYVPTLPFELPLGRIVSGGVKIGRQDGKIFKPDHHFFSAFGSNMFCHEADGEEIKRYMHGEELSGDYNGYGVITVLDAPLGGFKGVGGRYKNLYPKGLRI